MLICLFKFILFVGNKLIIFGGMNNLNYLGASLLIFDLDSHINIKSYKPGYFKLDKKNERNSKRKSVSFVARPKTILMNAQLPPIK